jgi:hypothetical protein
MLLLLLVLVLLMVVVMHVVGRRPAHVMLMLLQAVFTHSPILPLPQTAIISLTTPGLILLDFVALIMAACVVGRRAPIAAEVGQMIPPSSLLLMVGMLLLLLRGMMMLMMAVVVQPRSEHVEVGLQRLEQFVHHIAARHRLVAKRIVGMMVGGRRRTSSPLGGVIARGSGRRWRAGDGQPLLMLAREVLVAGLQ